MFDRNFKTSCNISIASVFLFSLINLFIPGMVGEIMRLSSLLVLREVFQVAGCLTLDLRVSSKQTLKWV